MMSGTTRGRMKSINIQATVDLVGKIDKVAGGNRSRTIREILAAVLAAHADGNDAPVRAAADFARATEPRVRRALGDAGLESWMKTIVWIPGAMNAELEQVAKDCGLRPSDMIRGAVFGAFGENPSLKLSAEGHEHWAGEVRQVAGD